MLCVGTKKCVFGLNISLSLPHVKINKMAPKMPGNSWIFRGIADLCWLQNEPRQYTKQRRWSKQEQIRQNRQYLCESPAATRMLWPWTLGRKWPSIPNWSLPVYWVTRSVGRAFSLTDSSLKMARKKIQAMGPDQWLWMMTLDTVILKYWYSRTQAVSTAQRTESMACVN